MDHKTNWKYILIVLILALIAAGGTIACKKNLIKELTSLVKFLETSKAGKVLDTSSWKVYQNEQYGFEVKYPKELNVIENGPDPYELQFLSGQLISGTQEPLLRSINLENTNAEIILTINIPDHKNFPVVSGDYEWWLRPCGQEGFAEIKSQSKTFFSGYKTLIVVSVFENQRPNYYYCINFPSNPIIIYYNEKFKEQADQILLSFKFIEPIVDTSTWKTYRNGEYGFEVRYPLNWYLTFEVPNVEFASVPRNQYSHGVGTPPFGEAWVTFISRNIKGADQEVIGEYNIIEITNFKQSGAKIIEIDLQFYNSDPREKEYRQIFNQILSTFKFIE